MQSLSSSPLFPLRGMSPVPSAPDTSLLRQQAADRLRIIETEALPRLARCRALMFRTWQSDAPDAVPVCSLPTGMVHAHPAGVDRMTGAIADHRAMLIEFSALCELLESLDRYEDGGSATARAIDGDLTDLDDACTLSEYVASADAIDRPTYTHWLLRYLIDLQPELSAARGHGPSERAAELERERDELQATIQRQSACTGIDASARTRRTKRSA